MTRLLIIIICSLLPLAASAQARIEGTVTDEGGAPMTGAIVQLRSNDTNKIIRFCKTDGKGTFSLETAADSHLEVSMLGYKKQRVETVPSQKPLKIVMQPEAFALKEVTVKASKVRERGDTISYTVAAYADQNDRSIGDVLAKIPGFEVNKQSGQILYEGKPISKFYIEELDMLGGKYGVATNSLPQVDVGSVQVMKHHQPIKVLEDFTYTDDAAVNIKMKESAKSHWVTSVNGGAGYIPNTGLWKLDGFGLRLKSDFQTMLTYKTNNTGKSISKETTNLFSLEDQAVTNDYISLSPPATPSLSESRTLFNRSHAVTVNTMKRLNEASQVNVQLIYNNNRRTAQGERLTEYFLPDGTLTVNNRKDYLQKDNELYALVKYEKNSEQQYLKNSLSGNLNWSRQWLDETSTNAHRLFARKPEYDIKDNLNIIRKYGHNLVSLYSDNRMTSRPQSLSVDSIFQRISQQSYSTHTYIMGGTRLGSLNLSLKGGVKAALHRLETGLTGLPDTLGLLADDTRFSFARFYAEPTLAYKTRDVNIELRPTAEYLYERFSEDKGSHQPLFSPALSVRWYATPRLKFSVNASSEAESSSPYRFHRTLILQDFQYINQGWTGYRHDLNRSLRGMVTYNDAMHSVHTLLTVSRSFHTSPYTVTRQFVGDYIILSAVEQESRSDSWQATLMANKGLNIWNGVATLRVIYLNSNSALLQNSIPTRFNSQTVNAQSNIDFSFWKDMHLKYGVNFAQSRMRMKQSSTASDIHNWKHSLSLVLPIRQFSIDLNGEYYHNQLAKDYYKDFFLADIKTSYKAKRFDIDLTLSNIFNRKTYSYVLNSDLMSSSSTNQIRGREILISLYLKK